MTHALSPNIAALSSSPTLAIFERVRAARAAGRTVIDLGIGEPSFPTPRFIGEAAARAIAEGRTRYTAVEGIAPLREEIAIDASSLSQGRTAIDVSQVVVSCGSKQSLFQTCFVLFGPGDEVLIPTPAWPSYMEMVRLSRATPVAVLGDPAHAWKAGVDALREHATHKTRGLLLGSPVNPTGSVYSLDELAAIAALAAERGWWIISDEIYRPLAYDAPAHSVLAACGSDASVVAIGGVAKAYSMTGWRIGWAVAPRQVASAMTALQSHLTSNATTISQYAALAALGQREQAAEAMRAMLSALRVRREIAADALSGVYPRLARPAGAFYYLLPTSDMAPGSSARFATALLEECSVAVVPGSAFGAEGWVRASYAGDDADVRTGFQRLAAFLAKGASH